jgi:hypothetical protein
MTSGAFPRWLPPPAGYQAVEPTAGVLWAVPWSWLAAVPLATNGRAAWRAWRRTGSEAAPGPDAPARFWCHAAFVIGASVTLAPALSWFSTMRYLGDATPGLLLLSTLGAWSLLEEAGEATWRRHTVTAVCLLLAAVTVVLGVLLGIEGYYTAFKDYNPALYTKLVAQLSFCGR